MFERVPDVGGPIFRKARRNKHPENIIPPQDGIPCPHGCIGTAWRVYGLVKHLMEVHGYSEKQAWRKAKK